MKSVLVSALRAAGAILREDRKRRIEIGYKADRETVSSADLESDRAIRRIVSGAFPEHAIISEESSTAIPTRSGYAWIVDPLDGTNNYLAGSPVYSVNVALARHSGASWRIEIGGIYLPATDELFLAERGGGAWLGGKRLRVARTAKTSEAKVIFCHGYTPADIRRGGRMYGLVHPHIRVCRMLGAAGVEMSQVASGGMDAFIYSGAKAWDVAPGALLVREAGGKVTDEDGEDWRIGMKPKALLVASRGAHAGLIGYVRQAAG